MRGATSCTGSDWDHIHHPFGAADGTSPPMSARSQTSSGGRVVEPLTRTAPSGWLLAPACCPRLLSRASRSWCFVYYTMYVMLGNESTEFHLKHTFWPGFGVKRKGSSVICEESSTGYWAAARRRRLWHSRARQALCSARPLWPGMASFQHFRDLATRHGC